MSHQKTVDGGVRGWIVVIAAFFMITIVSGVRRSMGLIFIEIFNMCDAPRRTVSLIVSMYFCFSLVGTLAVVLLARRFGTRVVVFGGGLLSSIAMFAAAFVNSAEAFILLLGFTAGVGHSCTYIPAMVLVSQHFEKRRTLAVGLSSSGGSVGAFILPPLLAFAAERYAASGMLIILSGFNLHILVSAMLLTPPVQMDEQVEVAPTEKHPSLPVPAIVLVNNNICEDHEEKKELFISESNLSTSAQSRLDDLSVDNSRLTTPFISIHDMGSIVSIPRYLTNDEKDSNRKSFLRQRRFYEVSVSTAFISFGQAASFILTPLLAEDLGIARYDQSVLLLPAGCTDLIFRILIGLVADRFPKYRILIFNGIAVASALNWTLAAMVSSFGGIFCFSFIQGGVGAAYFTLAVTVITDIIGLQNLDMAMSCRAIIQAMLLLATPPMMAIIRENAGQWRFSCWIVPFYCAVSIIALARHVCCNKRVNDGEKDDEKL